MRWHEAVLALALVSAVTSDTASARPGVASCDRQILLLAPLTGHHDSYLSAMNENGLAVGASTAHHTTETPYVTEYSAAVLWRDGAVMDLDIGSGPVADGAVNSAAVDVNGQGAVVARRWRTDRRGLTGLGSSSWLWRDGNKTRLRGSHERHHVFVQALNDRGVAVGYITAPAKTEHPAAWRSGERLRLPLPKGADQGVAERINDVGLVIGSVTMRGSETPQPWSWKLGGPSGPLLSAPGEDSRVVDVDIKGRILGSTYAERRVWGVLWTEPGARPRVLEKPVFGKAIAMNDHGDVTGFAGGFRGYGDRPWVSNLNHQRVIRLPAPPNGEWDTVHGRSVIRGVTPFAPQGGVAVGGTSASAHVEGSLGSRGTIWTCVQTY